MKIKSCIKSCFQVKDITKINNISSHNHLKRTLTLIDLITLGIGSIIGTGIFVLTGVVAAKTAGPAIIASYVIAGLVCIFSALIYIEMATLMPVAGSSYSYIYASCGQFIAWLTGLYLILEYAIGGSAVAVGWAGYLKGILAQNNIYLPEKITKSPFEGGIANVPAGIISFIVGLLVAKGTKKSIWLNRILVVVKILIIALFIIIATPKVNFANYQNFTPFGFDSIAVAAEEAKNPQKNLPIAIIIAILFCLLLYVLVAFCLTGIVNYQLLDNSEPMAFALRQIGSNLGSIFIAIGAIFGMVAVLIAMIYGQSRIFFAIARDGLLPKKLAVIHPRLQTPYFSCILTTAIVTISAMIMPLEVMSNLSSIGTLIALIFISIGAVILRKTKPNLNRPFKCPQILLIATISVLGCGYLTINLINKISIIFWLITIFGTLFYFVKKISDKSLN